MLLLGINYLTFLDEDCEEIFYDAPSSTWNIRYNKKIQSE